MSTKNGENCNNNKCTYNLNEFLEKKIKIFQKFNLYNFSLTLQLLSNYEEYLKVMKIVPLVSRCYIVHNKEFIEGLLKEKCYYPIIVKLQENIKESSDFEIIGYFEIYLLPHLGRTFDARFERVVVHPKYRSYGICQEMIRFGIDFCKNTLKCNRIDLYSENEAAIHIFLKYGFSPVDTNVYRIYLTE